ncbi:hypothetical protein F9B85_00860 [Heliorestis acidaminivorans]|uniref:Nucleotide exchange factor GrpE n=1 Tax=Heliorestis acidaminivorans TaxID=553427 RepID=A0A6I0F615_9FIRM|nr:hypothetical protein [Heliorestis acidaminivorans]KAB2954277.1 hypothetical protein F9B85_00860 [Heliorestis acidaminivorans]
MIYTDKAYIEQMLTALEHPKVIAKLKEILDLPADESAISTPKEVHQWRERYMTLEKALQQAKQEIADLQKDLEHQQAEQCKLVNQIETSQHLTEQYRKERSCLSEKLLSFQNKYKQVESAYAQYQSLSEKTARELTGIFKRDTPESFIACGAQLDNIDSLWEYTKQQIIAGQNTDRAELISLITFFLELHNKLFEQPLFAWQIVQPGEEFDASKHIRTADSKASGRISQVCLLGYKNVNTEKLIKKSVVRI